MKRTSTLLAVSVLFHLVVIDLTYLWISTDRLGSIMPIASYNLIWILVALSIASHQIRESRGNNEKISS